MRFFQRLLNVHFNWTTALYRHGDLIKKFLMWPSWLPLPAYISHGVAISPYFDRHELNNNFLVNLHYGERPYWQIKSPFKVFFQIPHPYLILHREMFSLPSPGRKGLLVFWPHTTPSLQYEKSYVSEYLEFLCSIEPNFDRVDVCIASNDLSQPWLDLISEKFNIVTAGSSLQPEFPEKLFALIDSYQYATGPEGGSELFYCHIMGVNYFVDGPISPYFNSGDENIVPGWYTSESYAGLHKYEQSYQKELFSYPNLHKLYREKTAYVKKHLGFNAKVNKFYLIFLLLLDFPRQCLVFLFNYARKVLFKFF